jgi:hypothetical protein
MSNAKNNQTFATAPVLLALLGLAFSFWLAYYIGGG